MNIQIILILLVFSCFGCNGQQNKGSANEKKLLSVKLSPDDSRFVFSYSVNGQMSIYTSNTDGNYVKLIARPEKSESYSHPCYSPDGERILYISFSKDTKKSAIFITDKTGNNKQALTDYSHLITEATFSHDGATIYYCRAEEFKSYSPISSKSPHKMDVFSIGIKNKEIEQITEIKAYSIENIISIDSSIMFIQSLEGPFIFRTNEPENVEAITFKNTEEVKIIGCGGFSIKNETLYFLSGGAYQLYKMNIDGGNAQLIMHNNFQMYNLDFFNNSNKFFFTKSISGNSKVVIYDLNDQSHKEVLFEIE